MLRTLISSQTLLLHEILPFARLNGRLSDHFYGFALLLFLFVLYAVFGFPRAGDAGRRRAKERQKSKKKRKPDPSAKAKTDPLIPLRYAAVCLFFLSAAFWCLQYYREPFLPVPSFVNLPAVFVLAAGISRSDLRLPAFLLKLSAVLQRKAIGVIES